MLVVVVISQPARKVSRLHKKKTPINCIFFSGRQRPGQTAEAEDAEEVEGEQQPVQRVSARGHREDRPGEEDIHQDQLRRFAQPQQLQSDQK